MAIFNHKVEYLTTEDLRLEQMIMRELWSAYLMTRLPLRVGSDMRLILQPGDFIRFPYLNSGMPPFLIMYGDV